MPPRFGGFFDIDTGGRLRLGTELSTTKGGANSLRAGSERIYDDSYRAHFLLILGDRDKDSV